MDRFIRPFTLLLFSVIFLTLSILGLVYILADGNTIFDKPIPMSGIILLK